MIMQTERDLQLTRYYNLENEENSTTVATSGEFRGNG